MGFRVYRPYVFPDAIDPAIGKELQRLGVKFEPELHAGTDAIVCLLGHQGRRGAARHGAEAAGRLERGGRLRQHRRARVHARAA